VKWVVQSYVVNCHFVFIVVAWWRFRDTTI